MDLEVFDSNQISGRGNVRHGGRVVAHAPRITGVVDGKAVSLQVHYRNTTVNYRLELQEDGTMAGYQGKDFPVIAKKVE